MVKVTPPPTKSLRIVITMPQDYRFGRETILGAAKYCVTHGLQLLHFGGAVFDPRSAQAAGLIGYASRPELAEEFRKMGVPIVNTSSRYPVTEVPSVLFDNKAVGRVAARHLIERGFKRLAYSGIQGHWYSTLRGDGFAEAAAEAGIPCDIGGDLQYDLLQNPRGCSLSRWLVSLPKPIGLMTCNDIRSRHVIELCRLLEINVPEEIAVVGVDNEEVICQAMEPGLSSVDPDAHRAGYEAAAMLHRIIQGKPPRSPVYVPPVGVVPRGSTNTVAATDSMVAAALALIHRNAASPIGVQDIAAEMRVSRRTLERRFEATLGDSVASSIRRAHVERAKQLLIDTDLPLDEVADASGFKFARQLRIAFLKSVGSSPNQFRRQFQANT